MHCGHFVFFDHHYDVIDQVISNLPFSRSAAIFRNGSCMVQSALHKSVQSVYSVHTYTKYTKVYNSVQIVHKCPQVIVIKKERMLVPSLVTNQPGLKRLCSDRPTNNTETNLVTLITTELQ